MLLNSETKYECPVCGKNRRLKNLAKHIAKHLSQNGSGPQYKGTRSSVMVKVPESVKKVASRAFDLKRIGFMGGQSTGWKRAKQLSTKTEIPIEDVRYMKAWFARHVFTSYPGYKKWVKAGKPKDKSWYRVHSIISWYIWGGSAAFNWVNSTKVLNLLNKHYPSKNYKQTKIAN